MVPFEDFTDVTLASTDTDEDDEDDEDDPIWWRSSNDKSYPVIKELSSDNS